MASLIKLQESTSVQQEILTSDFNTLSSIVPKLKNTAVKTELMKLIKTVNSQIDYLIDNPNHYE